MPIYKVVVWAETPTHNSLATEIIEVEKDCPPTDAEMHEIYQEFIGNLVESGYYLEGENVE